MRVSFVIPAYNESSIIKDTMSACQRYLREHYEDYELVIVDDHSSDDTLNIVRGCADTRTVVHTYPEHSGKGRAVREGMLKATGDIIVCTDADLAYGLDVIDGAVKKAQNADIVIGSRRLHPEGYASYTRMRYIASHIFAAIVSLFSGLNYDTQCGFKCFKKAAAQRVFSLCRTDGFAYDFEAIMLANKLGYGIEQYPVSIINHRKSKVRLVRDALRMLRDIIKIRASVRKTIREVKL